MRFTRRRKPYYKLLVDEGEIVRLDSSIGVLSGDPPRIWLHFIHPETRVELRALWSLEYVRDHHVPTLLRAIEVAEKIERKSQ
jgi:hypothetical protein